MATSRIRSRSSGLALSVEVDGLDRTMREFKEVRRRIATELAQVEQAAAEHAVLPEAKAKAARFKIAGENLAGHVIVRKAAKGPYLTTNMRGIRARAAGLLEYGGTVRTPVLPKKRKALLINGSPRASVRNARHYRGRHYLASAADERLGEFGAHVRDAIVDFFSET